MIGITITPHLEKAQRALAHIKNGVPRALAPAINRALASGKTAVKREIRKQYLIKAKDIPMTVQRANYGNLGGSIVIKDGMLPLEKFNVRPRGVQKRKNRSLVFAQVKKGGGGTLKSGFMIPRGGPYSRIGPERHPIFLMKTIGAAIMASQPAVGPVANQRMGDQLAKRVDHEIQRVLAGAGGR